MVTTRPKVMTMRVGSGENVRLGFPTTHRTSLLPAVRAIGPRHASPKLAPAARRLRGAPLVTRASGSGDAGADDDTSSGEGMDMSLLLSRINEMKDREVNEDKACAANWKVGRCTHHTVDIIETYVRGLKMHGDAVACGTFLGEAVILHGLDGRGAGGGVVDGSPAQPGRTAKFRQRFPGHATEVCAIDYDGSHLATGALDSSVLLWRVPPLEGAYSEPADRAAGERGGGEVGEAVYRSGELEGSFELKGHTEPVSGVQLTPDHVVTGSLDGSIRLWDKSTGALQQSVDLGVAVTSFHHTGEYIVAGLGSGQVAALTAGSAEKAPKVLLQFDAHQAPVTAVRMRHDAAFSQDVLVTGSQDGTLRSWDFSSGGAPLQSFTGHRAWVADLAFDQAKLVTAAKDGSVRVWNVRSGECYFAFYGFTAYINSVQFDRTRLISDGVNDMVLMHDFAAGAPPRDEEEDLDC